MLLIYLWREMRRRRRQALLTALGLAVGVALVVVLSAFAGGVRDAQREVLHSLYGVGTDITVTQTGAAREAGPQRFGMQPPDLSRQGERFARSSLMIRPGQESFPAARVAAIARADGVAAATGSLSLMSLNVSGRFAEVVQSRSESSGGVGGGAPQSMPSMAPIEVSSFAVAGVETDNLSLGPLSAARLVRGRLLKADDAKAMVALVTSAYAKQKGLAVGDVVKVGGSRFTVVGLVALPAGSSGSDVYIPLWWAQKLSDNEGKVNQVYVQATGADRIAVAKAAIEDLMPKATVTTSEDLARQVTGSLSSAASLADRLGRWLAVAGVVVAMAVASLLTVANVSRRVREFGTLRALGWRRRRVVLQVVAEAAVQGVAGAVIGMALGVGVARGVTALAPTLTAYVGPAAASPGGGPAGAVAAAGRAAAAVTVHLTAPVSPRLAALAGLLAVAGGLLAGVAGGWRAARLLPVDALRRVE